MDRDLLGSSLRYHGSYLLKQMAIEDQLTEEDVDALRNSYQIPQVDEPRDEFDCKLVKFIAKKADLLFSKENNDDVRKCSHKSSRLCYCAVLPPLEFFMEVSKTARKQQLYRNLNRGDVVVGVITAQHDIGLTVSLLALDGGAARDIADLKLVAFCPLREIPKTHAHEDPLVAFSLKDKIRAVVVGVTDDKITISMQRRALPSHLSCALGTITDEDIPAYCRAVESVDSRSYNTMLREAPEFNNPSDVCNMSEAFGLNEVEFQPSLMRRRYRVKYNEADYADKLRKEQSYRLAMRSVAEGVDHFKHGRMVEAMQMFNKALQVDIENVEALVARGALYANSEGYERALEDFDTALAINPNHVNAQKYACDTLLALGRSLLEIGDTNSAISKVYRASLLRPNNPDTAELLADIKRRMLESDGIVSSDTAAVEEDNSAVVHHHDASRSKGKAVRDRRISSASGNRSDTTRKRQRTVSSSDVDDRSSSSKPTKHRRKRRSRAERRPSTKSLEWIQRDATDVHPKSPLTELVGCTKSDQQKAYDVNFMNPERRQSADNGEATVGLTSSYGPALPPASPPARGASKKSTTDRAGRAVRKKTSKRSRKRSVSRSSSSSDSSGSSRTGRSTSPSSSSTSDGSDHGKRSDIQQGKDKRKKRKRNSLKTTSKKTERALLLAGKQSKANRSASREANERSVSSRSRSSSGSRSPLQSSRKQKVKHERSRSAERDRAKLRRKSASTRSSGGNAADDGTISSGRASAGEYRHGQADSRRVDEHSVANRSSLDSRHSTGDWRRKSEKKQAQIEVQKQSTSKRSEQHSSSSSPSSQSDVNALPCKPVVTVKVDERLSKNGTTGSGSKISSSADDNKTKKSGESLRDMEDFLKQLKANSQLKGFKK